jgi:membrane-associated protease RseP (regulator of RpoE activity)
MRLWPFGRRVRDAAPATGDRFFLEDLLRRNLDDVVLVRDSQSEGAVVVFRGELLAEPRRALDVLLRRYQPLGYTPFLRTDALGVAVHLWPLAQATERPRVAVNVVLFVLTCASMLLAGLSFIGSPTFDAYRLASPWMLQLLAGVPFAATLLSILGTHEFGHYFTARYYRASVSLPYFIPAPFLSGTLGAVIRMRSPARDRDSLFDIAAAGPLAGMVVAVPAMIIGLGWSRVVPVTEQAAVVFGDSLLLKLLTYLTFGPIPDGMRVFTHPMVDAAWAGFFVTALNLFPVGQLDGGRIAYAMFGRHHRTFGIATVVALVALTAITWSPNWLVWALLIFFLVGFDHHPPLDDVTPLSQRRRALGWLCLVLLVLLIPPTPFWIE